MIHDSPETNILMTSSPRMDSGRGLNGPNETFDKDRVVTAEAELVTGDIPASPGVIGGIYQQLVMGPHTLWHKRQLLLLKQKPWYIPKSMWHWMYKVMIVQSEERYG